MGRCGQWEHKPQIRQPGWAQISAAAIWEEGKAAIRSVTAFNPGVEIQALWVSSLREAVVPVSEDRQIRDASLVMRAVSAQVASDLGLRPGARIVSGAQDQCVPMQPAVVWSTAAGERGRAEAEPGVSQSLITTKINP